MQNKLNVCSPYLISIQKDEKCVTICYLYVKFQRNKTQGEIILTSHPRNGHRSNAVYGYKQQSVKRKIDLSNGLDLPHTVSKPYDRDSQDDKEDATKKL